MANVLTIAGGIEIPLDEFSFSFARSGGPGGQNVNKVASKAVLRWPVAVSPSLPEDVRQRFIEKYGNKITVEGELVIAGQQFRDQRKNMDDCLARLKRMLDEVAVPDAPRIATQPSRGAKVRRVEAKQKQSRKKADRRWRADF